MLALSLSLSGLAKAGSSPDPKRPLKPYFPSGKCGGQKDAPHSTQLWYPGDHPKCCIHTHIHTHTHS
uniref:Putative secreted protein n=1 Tax=Anopheles darlingi TaxID=43151 RepID=A0A2M4DJL1_ANODA